MGDSLEIFQTVASKRRDQLALGAGSLAHAFRHRHSGRPVVLPAVAIVLLSHANHAVVRLVTAVCSDASELAVSVVLPCTVADNSGPGSHSADHNAGLAPVFEPLPGDQDLIKITTSGCSAIHTVFQ